MSDEAKLQLPVRVRRTLCGDDRWRTFLHVHCPERSHSVSVMECSRCRNCDGLWQEHGQATLRCFKAPRRPQDVRATADVGSQMAPVAVCVGPDVTLPRLAAVMHETGQRALPVVDGDGHALGLISRSDLEPAGPRSAASEPVPAALSTPSDAEPQRPALASDTMTALPLWVPDDCGVARAAALMSYERVHQLIVVDAQLRVVGLFDALDVARWAARCAGFAVPGPSH